MTNLDINAKSDRELLIIAVEKLNHVCGRVDKHEAIFYNKGYGIIFQVRALWLIASGVVAVFLVYVKKVV